MKGAPFARHVIFACGVFIMDPKGTVLITIFYFNITSRILSGFIRRMPVFDLGDQIQCSAEAATPIRFLENRIERRIIIRRAGVQRIIYRICESGRHEATIADFRDGGH